MSSPSIPKASPHQLESLRQLADGSVDLIVAALDWAGVDSITTTRAMQYLDPQAWHDTSHLHSDETST